MFTLTSPVLHAFFLLLALACSSAKASSPYEDFKVDHNRELISIAVGEVSLVNGSGAAIFVAYATPIDAKQDFSKLSPEEQSIWRSLYENMPSTDEPPFPKGGLVTILRGIAAENWHAELSGEIDVQVDIGPDGIPRKADIFAVPSPEFGKRVLQVVLSAKYTPARCGDKACAMAIPIRIMLVQPRALRL